MKLLMTLDEAAAYLRLPKNTIYKLTCARRIPFFKPGKRLLFDREALDEWLNSFRHHTVEEIQSTTTFNPIKSNPVC